MDNGINTRKPRELQTRELSKRPTSWMPQAHFPTPNPEEGFGFRWIRTSFGGQEDPNNVNNKMREGWEPVRAVDHPELALYEVQTGKFAGGVEFGGLILMKTPIEFIRDRDAYYAAQANGQMKSVEQSFMNNNDSRMPLFSEQKARTSFGRG